MFCKKCGFAMKDDDKFCPFCGQGVDEPVVMTTRKYESAPKEVKDGIRNNLGYVDTHIKPILHLIIGLVGYGLMDIVASLIYSFLIGVKMAEEPIYGCAFDSSIACPDEINAELTNLSITVQTITEIVFIVIFALIFMKSLKPFFKEFKESKTYKTFGIALGSMYACTLVYSIILTSNGIISTSENQELVNEAILTNPIMGFLFVVIAAPIFEELVFRLGIFRAFTGKGKTLEIIGIFVTAILFAGIHLVATFTTAFADPSNINYELIKSDLWTLPSYLIGAFGLTIAYAKSKNFASNVITHMVWNCISYVAIISTSLLPSIEEIAEVIIKMFN